MTWLDLDEIAESLRQAHPQADPYAVRFPQLKAWVLDLPGFLGKAEDVNERKLEAIQAAWAEALADAEPGDDQDEEDA